jgi:hypothetical protein
MRNSLDFGYLEDPKISLPLMESIQRIVIQAEIFGQTVPPNRAMEHPAQRHSINDAVVDAKTNDATGRSSRAQSAYAPGQMRTIAERESETAASWDE